MRCCSYASSGWPACRGLWYNGPKGKIPNPPGPPQSSETKTMFISEKHASRSGMMTPKMPQWADDSLRGLNPKQKIQGPGATSRVITGAVVVDRSNIKVIQEDRHDP